MKTKYLFLVAAMTVATSASAQFMQSGGRGKVTSKTELDHKSHFVTEVRLGGVASAGGFGVNFGGTREIASFGGCTLAWDFINVEFSAPFSSPADLDMLSLKTGLRLFSPSFAKDNLRFYTNISMGYTCVLMRGLGNAADSSDYEGYLDDNYNYDYDDYYSYLYDRYYDDMDYSEFLSDQTKMRAHHGFGLTWGAGVQIKKKFSIGYTLQYETAFKSKNHLATFGFTF